MGRWHSFTLAPVRLKPDSAGVRLNSLIAIRSAWQRQPFVGHPNPSEVKSFTTAPSNCTTTLIGKVRGARVVQVSKDVLFGFTAQVLSWSEIRTVRALPVKSGAESTILKLIKFMDRSQLVTSPVSRGGGGVGDIATVGEACAIGDAGEVGVVTGVSVGVGWGAMPHNCKSRFSFEAEYSGEEAVNFPGMTGCLTVPSGHI